jgi:hypothetical protein
LKFFVRKSGFRGIALQQDLADRQARLQRTLAATRYEWP